MKRQKRLTKKQRKEQEAAAGNAHQHSHAHIHCVACGRHIHPQEFTASPVRANYLRCQHGTQYAACKGCVGRAMNLIQEHDRTGRAVQVAGAWH